MQSTLYRGGGSKEREFVIPSQYKESYYGREENLLQECTFKPVLPGDSPFISERTLRNVALQHNRRRKPPPPGDPQEQKRSMGGMIKISLTGFYGTGTGLVKEPPKEPGLQIYFYDPFSPPFFDLGPSVMSTLLAFNNTAHHSIIRTQ